MRAGRLKRRRKLIPTRCCPFVDTWGWVRGRQICHAHAKALSRRWHRIKSRPSVIRNRRPSGESVCPNISIETVVARRNLNSGDQSELC